MSTKADMQRQNALLERAERIAGSGTWEWDPDSGEVVWSDNLFRLMGSDPSEIPPSMEYLSDGTHPEDRERYGRFIERAEDADQVAPIEFRIIRPDDGSVRHLRSTVAQFEAVENHPRLIVGVVQDVTDRDRAGHEIAAHVAVAEALAAWESLDQSGERLVRSVAEAMGCVAAALWIRHEDVLIARVFWHSESVDLAEFEAGTRRLRIPKGSGLPGAVWEWGRPINVASVPDDPRFARRAPAARGRLQGVMALPALADDEVLAVLELYSREETELSKRLMRSLSAIGHELGQFLACHRTELELPALSTRELDVLRVMATGATNADIAERLTISASTVRSHVKHILQKLDVRNRTEAAARFLGG